MEAFRGRGATRAKNFFAVLLLFIACSFQNALAEGQSGQALPLDFTAAETMELMPMLRLPIEPTSVQISEFLAQLSPTTFAKLKALGSPEAMVGAQPDAARFAHDHLLTAKDMVEIRKALQESIVAETLLFLKAHPRSEVRFLGRDMNESFHYFVARLMNETYQPELSFEQRLDILKRAKPVTLSRKAADKIQDVGTLAAALAISSEAMEAPGSAFRLIDLGYEGHLAERVNAVAAGSPLAAKLKWWFVFKAPSASSEIESFGLAEFNEMIAARFPRLLEDRRLHRIPDGFRIRALEHSPKWNRPDRGFVEGPVYLMLDADDTILKEVDVAKFGRHENVQSVVYEPSPHQMEEYRRRLKEGARNDQVIHYEIQDDGKLKGYVVVRPAMEELFRDLGSLLENGDVKILLTSANDEKRSEALASQLRVAGKTLKEWGVQFVSPNNFGISGGKKSVAKLRDDLGISRQVPIVAIDDLGERIVDILPQDEVISVEPWNREHSVAYLTEADAAKKFSLRDLASFRNIGAVIRNKRFQRDPSSVEDRLKTLATLADLFGFPEAPPARVAPEPKSRAYPRVTNPDILEVTPKARTGLHPKWPLWRRGMVEAAVYMRAFFRGEEIYATGRDALAPLYALQLAAKDDPEFYAHLHALDVSTNSSGTKYFGAFLAQEGISRERLRNGLRVRLFDGGYSGHLLDRVRWELGNEFDSQIRQYFLLGNPERKRTHYSFLFATAINPEAATQMGRQYVRDIQETEREIPKQVPKTMRYEEKDGKWVPIRANENGQWLDGQLSPEGHLAYMEDLAHYVLSPEIQKLIAARYEMWTVLKRLADERKDKELLHELKNIAANAAHDPFAEAIVYEMISYSPAPFRIEGHGQTFQINLASPGCKALALIHAPRPRNE